MLMVLSPAKTLDYESPLTTEVHSLPDFIPRSAELISTLRELSPDKLGSLMQISDQLAHLNADRYASWSKRFNFKKREKKSDWLNTKTENISKLHPNHNFPSFSRMYSFKLYNRFV
jgi:hypothetical protein